MKDIGIVICNYNKQDYIIPCIQSILDSSINNFDIYVVDNASEDRSVDMILNTFGSQVTLLVNAENLGGSGGFNAGIRETLKKDYRYIMLMDNDIVADQYAVEALFSFMESHPEVGMAGSKVYFMDFPDRIWGYGGHIDFGSYVQKDHFKNATDGPGIPDVDMSCDYVAACSLIARSDAIKKVGLMPDDNFIYWDDMEWGWRFCQAGYKVAVCGASKIWHKAGGRNAGNTFINYYMWRNRIRFFLKVLPKDKLGHFAETILAELFRMIYSCHLKGEDNIVRSVMYALDDALHGVSGKAAEYKILPRSATMNRLQQALSGAGNVIILYNGNLEGLGNIIRSIRSYYKDMKVTISLRDAMESVDFIREQFPDSEVTEGYQPERYEAHLRMCSHIFEVTKEMEQDVYIDAWCNIIYTPEDFLYASSFEQTKRLFLISQKGLMEQRCTERVVPL